MPPVAIVKVGGSLFPPEQTSSRLHELLTSLDDRRILIIMGGGAGADAVRRLDRAHNIGDERAHHLAIAAMDANAVRLSQALPHATIVTDRIQARAAWAGDRLPILLASRFLQTEEQSADNVLPRSWNVTSDSIAAWTAHRWPSSHLVLAKSSNLPADASIARAAECGLVDLEFPRAACGIGCVQWVNLRSERISVQEFTVASPAAHVGSPGGMIGQT